MQNTPWSAAADIPLWRRSRITIAAGSGIC